MAESPDAAAGAGALDDVGVVSAQLFLPSSSFLDVPDSELVRSAPFSTLALGITVIEGRAANVIAYVFADEAAAAAVAPELEEEWRSGDVRATFGEPVSTFFDVQSVEPHGRVVVVTAPVTDIGNTSAAEQFLIRGDPLFSNT